MNAVEEEFRANIFEIAGFMATVISFNRKSSAIAGFMATVISFNRKPSAIAGFMATACDSFNTKTKRLLQLLDLQRPRDFL